MVFGPSGVTMTSQTDYAWFGRHPYTLKQPRQNHITFSKHHFVFSKPSILRTLKNGAESSHAPCNKFLKILSMGAISITKTWNGNLVIWDQCLSNNMKRKFGNMESISLRRWNGHLVIWEHLSNKWNGHLEDRINIAKNTWNGSLVISIKRTRTIGIYVYFQLKELKHLKCSFIFN